MSWTAAAIVGGNVVSGMIGSDAAKDAGATQAAAADRASANQMAMFDKTQANLQPWASGGKLALSELNRLLGLGGSRGANGKLGAEDVNAIYQHYVGRTAAPEEISAQMRAFTKASDVDRAMREGPEYAARMAGGMPSMNPLYADQAQIQAREEETGMASGSLLKPFGMEDFQESPAYQFNLAQGQKAIDKASNARGKYYAPSTLQDIAKFSQGMASNEFQNAYGNYNTNMRNIWDRLYSMSGSGQNAAAQTGAFGSNAANAVSNNITSAGAAQAAGGVGAANAISGGINGAYNGYMTNQILQSLQAPAYKPQVQSSVPGQFNFDTYG